MLQLKRRPILWLATLIFAALLAFSVAPTRANTALLWQQLNLGQKGVSSEAADINELSSLTPRVPNYGTEDCRIGVIVGLHNDNIETNQWIETLDASWYINFAPHVSTYRNTSGQNTVVDGRHLPIIHIKQDRHPVTGARLDTYEMQLGGGQTLTEDVLTGYINFNRGGLWAIGNEPDREGAQDDTMPDVYARAFHEIREFVLSVDPTAQFANAGLVQVTPSRIEYLNNVMYEYETRYGTEMPVDVWNIHVYPLEELTAEGEISGIASIALGSSTANGMSAPPDRSQGELYCNSGDPESPFYENNLSFVTDNITCLSEHDDVRVFRHQVETMRVWMKNNGEQDKPLIISEMGVLWPYTEINDGNPETCGFLQDEFGRCLSPRRVSRFMSDVNDYLLTASDPNLGYSKGSEHKLVQQWAWFSVFQTDQQRAPGGSLNGEENEAIASSSNLIRDPWDYLVPGQQSALTEIGETFQSYAQTPASELVPNLYIDGAPTAEVIRQTAEGLNVVRFTIPIRNDGNTSTDAQTSVMLYADPTMPEQFPIGRIFAPDGIGGCATDLGYAVGEAHLLPDITEFYMKIRDGQDANDAFAGDNVYATASGNPIGTQIRVPAQSGAVFLPFLNTK